MAIHERSTDTGIGRQLTYGGAALALLLPGALAGCSSKKAPAACESPRATSPLFLPDPNATEDRTTWKKGIAIRTEVPADASGVVVGFRGPNADTWNDSLPVSPDRAQTTAVLVGNGAVSFSVYIIAPESSPACAGKPDVGFTGPQPMQTLIGEDAALPQWPK